MKGHRFFFYKQHDGMQCGIACLAMICRHFGRTYSMDNISKICFATHEGVSLLGINEAAGMLGLHTSCGRVDVETLNKAPLPCILHWNQNHFVVLYKIKNGKKYHIADPGKGLMTYNSEELCRHWVSTSSNGKEKGVAMFVQATPAFFERKGDVRHEKRSFKFLLGYFRQYRRYFGQIVLGLAVGSLLQLALPFLTQSIVDVGIKNQDIGFIWLVLLGQLMLTVSRTLVDFVRRWLLLHISMRINISLVSDFFIKLLKLPMSFFDTKLMGDIMQRMNDHSRVQRFLTDQTLSVLFSLLSFIVFGIVLFCYNRLIFLIFIVGSILYGVWIAAFLRRRKVLDYMLFEQQAINNNRTIRDGVGLSQGQRQRILIARAVYKDPKYIFLDEATNSLDANNERAIVENLDKFYAGRTVIVVAHRLSTVKNADHIVVLDRGRIVEQGTHVSLTAKRGAYYELVKNQLELGL
jgi:ATP-binding cassette subfamily B protein